MKLGTITQQSTERLSYSTSYADALSPGDTLANPVAVLVTPAGGLTCTATAVGDRVRFWLEGGVHLQTYKLELTVESVGGSRFQDEFVVKVKDY